MRRWNPENAGLLIEKYKCTHWANVPTMVVDLLASEKNNETDLSSLSNIFLGVGPQCPELSRNNYLIDVEFITWKDME